MNVVQSIYSILCGQTIFGLVIQFHTFLAHFIFLNFRKLWLWQSEWYGDGCLYYYN